MIISRKKDGPMQKKENRKAFLKENNLRIEDLVLAKQVHGKDVAIVGKDNRGKVIESVDGFLTTSKDIVMGITVADCLPISLYSKKVRGLLHAGWKGLEKGIIEEAFRRIVAIGEEPGNLSADIGPGIGSCHFEIKDDVIKAFKGFEEFIKEREGKSFMNLKGVAKRKLERVGAYNVNVSQECTYCEKERYYSFRRDKKVNSMLAVNYSFNQEI